MVGVCFLCVCIPAPGRGGVAPLNAECEGALAQNPQGGAHQLRIRSCPPNSDAAVRVLWIGPPGFMSTTPTTPLQKTREDEKKHPASAGGWRGFVHPTGFVHGEMSGFLDGKLDNQAGSRIRGWPFGWSGGPPPAIRMASLSCNILSQRRLRGPDWY